MKKQLRQNPASSIFKQPQADWRRWGATALLLCAMGGVSPTFAAVNPVNEDVGLNFVGADIEAVIKAIGHYTNITFIIDPRVKGTISLVSEKPLTKAQAFNLLTSTLRLQGFAVVLDDGFAKVVPEGDAKLQSGPTQIGFGKKSKVTGDQIATQIFHLNYESSTNLVTVLRPLISPNNTINANAGNNTLIITDYADNLARLAKIIASLDAPTASDTDVIPVRYAIASDLAVMVGKLLEPVGPDSGRIVLLADGRTNSLVLRAPSAARANLAKSLIAKLDQPTAQPGNVHVVYLKNSDAVKLAQTLRAVISSDSSASNVTPPAGGAGQPAPATLSTGGAAGFIQADPATNTLIITASEAVYRNLRVVVDQLDVRRAQVYIEALIVEVSAQTAAEFGVQWLGASGNNTSNYRLGGGTSFSSGGNNLISQALALSGKAGTAVTPALPGAGLTLGLFSQRYNQLGLGALAHALETNGDANILSTPNLITLDNEEAKISVAQTIPFLTGGYATQASTGAAGVNPFQTFDRKDVGLILKVKPQISEGGTVKMAISQESSSIDDSVPGPVGQQITKKRSIDTNVLADDGQIIVLGGLIQEDTSDGVEKVPGLGNIPIIGNFFKYQTRKRNKTNLMVFLRPTVIRSSQQTASVVADRYDYVRGAQIAAQPEKTPMLRDLTRSVLPPLQNGQPVGGTFLKIAPDMDFGVPRVTVREIKEPTATEPAEPIAPTAPAETTK